MASNYNRKSASSASRRGRTRPSARFQASDRYDRSDRFARPRVSSSNPQISSVRVGDIASSRNARAQATYHRYIVRLGIIAAVIVAALLAGVIVYNSPAFTIETVSVKGVEHLTATEMQELAAVPEGTTLLRVDAAGVKERLLKDTWVKDVTVKRVFPNTLEVDVTERTITAVVEIPSEGAQSTTNWAIASDGMWLMGIPDRDSEEGRRISQKVYEDADSVLHITDVPYGTKAEMGAYCSDANVNNALSIVAGMTTELADRVTSVKATETESTTLTIKDGPDIVFGAATDIREKERVCLQIMENHPEGVTYINVRTPDRPTWRSL